MLTIDPNDPNRVLYKGKVVAEVRTTGERSSVRIDFDYEASVDEWIVPLSHLATGLRALEPPAPPVALTLELDADSIESPGITQMMLLEKELKAGGYTWIFHKSDADPWPSPVHGHDYEHGLVLDAVTGKIYQVSNRKEVGTLKKKKLVKLQQDIKGNEDLKIAAAKYIP